MGRRPLQRGVILYQALLAVLIAASLTARSAAADFVTESMRYQRVWSPTRIELAVTEVTASQLPTKELQADGASWVARIAPEIRDAITAYAGEFGLSIVPATADKRCAPGEVTARILITPMPYDAKEKKLQHLRIVSIPMSVATADDCGFRRDFFTRAVEIPLTTGAEASNDVDLPRQIEPFGKDVVDELLLIWHPVWKEWNVRQDAPQPFTSFALEPLYPPGTRADVFGTLFRSEPYGVNGLGVTSIDTPNPRFRWNSLDSLVQRAEGAGLPGRISETRYEFRLYSSTVAGLGVVPARVILRREGLVDPQVELPSPLESCGIYFWTVRARFRLDDFPRVTEWTAMHNAAGGVVPPWRARRGEFNFSGWDPLLTLPAFRTPSAIGRGGCR